MRTLPEDLINYFAAIEPGSPLDALRNKRPEAKKQAQQAYLALFAPATAGGPTRTERFALGVFVLALHGMTEMAALYAEELVESGAEAGLAVAVSQAAAANQALGPYGAYPAGTLSTESDPGPAYFLENAIADELGPRLAAAFTHAHRLIFHPRDCAATHLQALFDAGWTEDCVVTISQLVSFLAYQARVVHGLRTLKKAGEPS